MEEETNKEIKQLTDGIIERINAMSNMEVSYSNVHFLFRRNKALEMFAIACIDRLEDKGIDSRGVSIAFSNSFSDNERCLEDTEGILEGGKYIIDAPQILIERAMLWLTERVITDCSFRAKVGINIPQEALKSNLAFDEFLKKG